MIRPGRAWRGDGDTRGAGKLAGVEETIEVRGRRGSTCGWNAMFVERSAARIRLVRTLFVLLGIVPCACLCGWAATRRSEWHREHVERSLSRALGFSCRIAGVGHPRPHVMRLREVLLATTTREEPVLIPVIDVESAPGEIRVTLPGLRCSPALARVLCGLSREWLVQPARFPVDCVVDVDMLEWTREPLEPDGSRGASHADGSPDAGAKLHVECVAANGSRAVRVRRFREGVAASDEVRVVIRGGAADEQRDRATPREAAAIEVSGEIVDPLPIDVFEAVCGFGAGALPLGRVASVSGAIDARCLDGAWSGNGRCRVERIDLASASRSWPYRLSGGAEVVVEHLEWNRDRVVTCDCRVSADRGVVGQRLLDGLVSALGCRPGAAYQSLARDTERRFDDVSCAVRFDAQGIGITAGPGRDQAIARRAGISIIDQPRSRIPLERVAWLLAPPGVAAVPATASTAWLLRWFSLEPARMAAVPEGASDDALRRDPGPRPAAPDGGGRTGQRQDF